ncbi:MAG: ABC transporter ATP-binding protein [Chloroflexi bacterium RBG_16_48_8]|nr:MAG: ABC transporter ATP-binding protein [Chloroflexi bacterium RBG_16_48_8]
MMSLLRVENVTAGYGVGPDILAGISFTVEVGKTYCIIGPNGAGKSTLLKTICGLLRPRDGKVVYMGEDISHLRPDQILMRGICLVPQERGLFPDMTVRENLVMGGYIIKDREILEHGINQVFNIFPILKERGSQRAKTLSGGEQQMLAMARALMLKPELLMIDEPSLGLAPKLAREIFDTIRSFKELGMTVLIVEQNARKGLAVSDWGYVLDLGRERFEGKASEILADERIQELYLGKK